MAVAGRDTAWRPAASSALLLARALPALLALTLFLTGASGLIYQVVWFRALGIIFGVTVQATSAVLAAFMAGLALGSLLAARLSDRLASPLRAYALAELGIGLAGFASLWAFDALQPLYRWVALQVTDALPLLTGARFVLAFLIMLVPTTLMGATLPLVVRAGATQGGRTAGWVGLLYASNTAGAVGGAFLAGFFWIGLYGLTVTTALAASFNLLAGVVWLVAGRWVAPIAANSPDRSQPAEPRTPPPLATLVLGCYALSGFIALAAEVVWTRVLAGIFPGNVYAFTLMLCAILLGIAGGSWLISPWLHRRANWLLVFAGLEALLGLLLLGSVAALAHAYVIEGWVRQLTGQRDLIVGDIGFMAFFGLLAIGPPALVMGALFPVAARIVAAGRPDVGRRVGLVYGGNVIGAIAGSLLGGLVLIPLVGAQRTLWLLAAGNLLIAASVLMASPLSLRRKAGVALLGGMAVVLVALATPDLYRTLFTTIPWNEETLWYHEGPDATIRVGAARRDGTRVLYINSEHQGTDRGSGLDFHYRLGHLGPLLHPAPEKVLVIGMGVGATAGAAALYPGTQVRVVELYPGVVEAARLFRHVNFALHERPNVEIVVNDGRNYLLLTREKFDVIEADPILPTNAGAAVLYSADYYRLARSALKDDGLMVQWLNNSLPGPAYRLLLRSFLDAFPYATLWENGSVLIGSPQPLLVDPQVVAAKFASPEVHRALAQLGYREAGDVLREFTAGPADLWAFAGEGPRVTDRFPAIEYIRTIPYDGTQATPQWGRAARFLDARATAADGIIYGEASVRRELAPYLRLRVPELVLPPSIEGRESTVRRDLAAFLAGKAQIWFVPWWQSEGDILTEAVLNAQAFLVDDRWLGGVRVLRYAGPAPEQWQPLEAQFGGLLRITHWSLAEGTRVQAGQVLRLSLVEEATADLHEDLKLSLRLVDPQGQVVAALDRLPRNAPLTEWQRGHRLTDRIGLLVPPGTPAGTYTLDLAVYRAASGQPLPLVGGPPSGRLALATIFVGEPQTVLPPAAAEVASPLEVMLGDRRLAGYTLEPATRRPGERIPLVLVWQGTGRSQAPGEVVIGDPTAPLVAAPLATDVLPDSVLRREAFALRLPATTPPGRYPLWLRVAGAPLLRLGALPVAAWPALPEPVAPARPLGVLVGGFAWLEGVTIQTGPGTTRVELVWEARSETDRSYVVFVHVLDAQGRLVGQSDRFPAGGAAPTLSWRPGQRVADVHELPVSLPPGGALALGMYDPETGARLPAGERDAILLSAP
ncbi:MAG: hypothetical protein KatS3mg061_1186 [Dehalococcoidia bacterium]|nr:MAG: hypothetical protein KatS3mg061_1186 [Dehalococcoidia bacterium]